MKWKDYLDRRQLYKKAWGSMKAEFTGEIRRFLDKSHIVVTYGANMTKQMAFEKNNAYSIAMGNRDFFLKDSCSNKLLYLVRRHDEIMDLARQNNSDEKKRDRYSELKLRAVKQLEDFNNEPLVVVDNQTEIRFPALNMNFIQQIKKSKYCDKESTSISKSSIRVILKTE